jgi:hypothetical protein
LQETLEQHTVRKLLHPAIQRGPRGSAEEEVTAMPDATTETPAVSDKVILQCDAGKA